MAESEAHNLSTTLYGYMCQNIVGTEEHVKSIRMMNSVKDNLASNKTVQTITSGSYGEGIEMRGSDIDIMKILKFIEVFEDKNTPLNPHKSHCAMETDETLPGFTQLRLLQGNRYFFAMSQNREGKYYFSNNAIKWPSTYMPLIHGPCVTDVKGLIDFAVCLHNKSWITQAMQWTTRPNNSWPAINVKASIVQHGVLFVPIGVKGSPNEAFEWRLSFSVGEKLLIYTFSHTQLLCYALMKIVLKDVIASDSECTDLLCSYFMKTILFWISEELSPKIWRPENLLPNFMRCFRRLIYCVENSVCPHYFIPENNLFETRIKGQAQKMLLNKLQSLNSYGQQLFLFSDQFLDFNNQVFYRIQISNNPHVDIVEKLLISKMFHVTEEMLRTEESTFDNKIHLLCTESSKIRHIYSYYISKLCFNNVQLLPLKDISNNKSNYRQYKICLSTLLQNVHHDAVSGWLLLATFFYKTKQYNLATYVLQYSLSKCTIEKLQLLTNLTNIHIFRKMTVAQLLTLLRVDDVHFRKNSTFIPDELAIEVKSKPCIIPPVLYAHFLYFLCHFHLTNTRQCRDSLQDLKLTIEEKFFIPDNSDNALGHNILGIAFQLAGDIESAKWAFLQSIRLGPNPDTN